MHVDDVAQPPQAVATHRPWRSNVDRDEPHSHDEEHATTGVIVVGET